MATIRVNFNKDVRMDLACSKDDIRPAMNCIYFENGYAYASDGYILVKNKLDECSSLDAEQIEALNGKLLYSKSYKDIIKYDRISISEDGIEAIKGQNKCFYCFCNTSDKYPSAEKVIQQYINKQDATVNKISFTLHLIVNIQKALYKGRECEFKFKGEYPYYAAIIKDNTNTSSSIGLLMGCLPRETN